MYQTGGNDFLDTGFNEFLLAVGGHSATKTARRQRLDFSSQECYSIGGGRCPFRLAIPLSSQLLWGSCGTPHNEFLAKPKYFPWLRQSGTYVLKDYRFFNLV